MGCVTPTNENYYEPFADTRKGNVRLVCVPGVEATYSVVLNGGVDASARWVVLVQEGEPLMLHTELFQTMARQNGQFLEGRLEDRPYIDLCDTFPQVCELGGNEANVLFSLAPAAS